MSKVRKQVENPEEKSLSKTYLVSLCMFQRHGSTSEGKERNGDKHQKKITNYSGNCMQMSFGKTKQQVKEPMTGLRYYKLEIIETAPHTMEQQLLSAEAINFGKTHRRLLRLQTAVA